MSVIQGRCPLPSSVLGWTGPSPLTSSLSWDLAFLIQQEDGPLSGSCCPCFLGLVCCSVLQVPTTESPSLQAFQWGQTGGRGGPEPIEDCLFQPVLTICKATSLSVAVIFSRVSPFRLLHNGLCWHNSLSGDYKETPLYWAAGQKKPSVYCPGAVRTGHLL